uniref:Uncharacterized protein n=1 Tax=Physcomitrium patens TaxID=3218 RepID=A0A2K1KCE7_PHYPA|nr:hypothetical protein PHYPA_010641 [Physcomitrium patens]
MRWRRLLDLYTGRLYLTKSSVRNRRHGGAHPCSWLNEASVSGTRHMNINEEVVLDTRSIDVKYIPCVSSNISLVWI